MSRNGTHVHAVCIYVIAITCLLINAFCIARDFYVVRLRRSFARSRVRLSSLLVYTHTHWCITYSHVHALSTGREKSLSHLVSGLSDSLHTHSTMSGSAPQADAAQLTAAVHAQGQQIAALLHHISQQSQQSASAASPPPYAGNNASKPRIPAPAAYEGAAAALDDWVAELEQQFDWYRTADAEKVQFATAFLKGAARDWWKHLASRPADWAGLVAALRKRFQPVTTAEVARAKLLTLNQGKSSVQDYVSSFRRLLISVPTMSEDDRLFQFLRGLRKDIATQLRMQGVTTLEEAVEKATRVGAASELSGASSSATTSSGSGAAPMELDAAMLNNVEGLEQETSSGSQTSSTGASSTVTRAELQQMLNAMREQRGGRRGGFTQRGGREGQQDTRRLPQIEHLSPQQVREYMAANKCFGCSSTEHRSRQCPLRKVDAHGRVSWGK